MDREQMNGFEAENYEVEEEEIEPVRGTNVSLILSGAIGVAATSVFYAPFLLILKRKYADLYLYQLFCERGWVPYAAMMLFFWSIAILILKIFRIQRERDAFDLALLPSDSTTYIMPNDAQGILRKINGPSLTDEDRQKTLVNRISRALLRLKLLGTADKVDDMLQYQADIDANTMESSYTAVKVFIWAIPIFGFLGTVMGISGAIQNFDKIIKAPPSASEEAKDMNGQGASDPADNLSDLRKHLPEVTKELGIAFDTTLLALILSVIIMFSTSALQKTEEDLLSDIEEFCLDSLLNKLYIGGAGLRQLEATMRKSMEGIKNAQSENFSESVEQFAEKQAEAIGRAMQSVSEKLLALESSQSQQFGQMAAAFSEFNSLGEAATQSTRMVEWENRVSNILEQMVTVQSDRMNQWEARMGAMMEEMMKSGRQLNEQVTALIDVQQRAEALTEVQKSLDDNLGSIAASNAFHDLLKGIQEALGELKPAIEELRKPRKVRFVEEVPDSQVSET